MNVLIYGFGRMGLTHYAILNGLSPGIKVSLIEPNRGLRAILKKNIAAKIYASDIGLKDGFDLVLITTPPTSHIELVHRCLDRGDLKIFVEKPFGGHNHVDFNRNVFKSKVFVGYVLRFNPSIQWVKSNVLPKDVRAVDIRYLSNTISKKPNGWRNGSFSGVLNEMGSHVIDLVQYILGDGELQVESAKTESCVSDVDDIVEARLSSRDRKLITIYLNWVKKEIRKPIFEIKLDMQDGSQYLIDQQQIKVLSGSGEHQKTISSAELAQTVPFYLRGVDFTNQMRGILHGNPEVATIEEALKVNKIMYNILNHEGNFRG